MKRLRAEGKLIMIQGTTSNAGKTTVAAGLCRILSQDGYRVAPFKAWNMALNSGVTPDGGEIGRGQIVQAEAAGIAPTVDMNPILLKPEPEGKSQLIIRGKIATPEEVKNLSTIEAREKIVQESLDRIRTIYDAIVMEGSGSSAEPNRIDKDIANMRVARYANAPVLIVGNIDPGGVYASLLGTAMILKDKDPEGYKLIKGFIINGFRGDPDILEEANDYLQEKTEIPVIGVIPFMESLGLAEEDSTGLTLRQRRKENAVLEVVVPFVEGSQTLQNTDDFKSLELEEGVSVRFIRKEEEFGNPDLVVLGGSKGTVADLHLLEQVGIADKIKLFAAKGGAVLGICGGYQMLGERLLDPEGVDSEEKELKGLGLLPAVTVFEKDKITQQAYARVEANSGLLAGTSGIEISGYEIHMGRTEVKGKPAMCITTRSGNPTEVPEGATDQGGWVVGTYLHGLLKNDRFRRRILNNLAERKGVKLPEPTYMTPDKEYDSLADTIRQNIDLNLLYQILDLRNPRLL
jgi:adenosylcobyric acid synthase